MVLSPEIAGSAMCAVMTSEAPAAIAALNGSELQRVRVAASVAPTSRKPDVRIDVGVAVPREMLRRRELPAILCTPDEQRRQPRDALPRSRRTTAC